MLRRGLGCGCGGLLVLLVAVVAAGYFLIYRPVAGFLASWQAPPSAQVPVSGGNLQAPLTRDEVQKFVRIRRDERSALGSSFTGVQNIFESLQNGQTPNVWQLTTVLREAGASLGQVRSAQTAGLVREKLSRERYNVIRQQVDRALGVPDIDFGTIASDLRGGRLPNVNAVVKSAADPRTVSLVEPFRAELTATAALGLLGL